MTENKEETKEENPKEKIPKGTAMMTYPTSVYGTVKTVTFCSNCGDRRSLISRPNTPSNLECQSCKSEFTTIIHK